MTAEIPGAGIGGIFYMVSAIAMPFHAAYRAVKRRNANPNDDLPVEWRPVFRQFAIGFGIVVALWLTGWALGALVTAHPSALGDLRPAGEGQAVPNVIRIGALMLSFGSLCAVLLAVQIGRLVVKRQRRNNVIGVLTAALLVFSAARAAAQDTAHVSSEILASHLAAAEKAYDAGDTATAAAEYQKVIALEPDHSRAGSRRNRSRCTVGMCPSSPRIRGGIWPSATSSPSTAVSLRRFGSMMKPHAWRPGNGMSPWDEPACLPVRVAPTQQSRY